MNITISGPQGCGKTILARCILDMLAGKLPPDKVRLFLNRHKYTIAEVQTKRRDVHIHRDGCPTKREDIPAHIRKCDCNRRTR